jgi:hypothetical protein
MKLLNRNYQALAFSALIVAVASGVGLRIYKANYTGITYDEVSSQGDFGMSCHSALTSYVNPNNNHVLNSVLLNFSRVHFARFEHYPRLHAMFFGGIYCIAAGWLAWSLIGNRLLRVLLVVLLVLQYAVFDLSYLARGYSIAIGAFYLAMAILVYLAGRPLRPRHLWIAAGALTVANVLCLGSMLSAIAIVVALNACSITTVTYISATSFSRRLLLFCTQIVAVGACSLTLLYLIYRYLWRDILAAKDNFGTTGLVAHLKEVLVTGMFATPSMLGWAAYAIFVFLATIGLVYVVCRRLSFTAPQLMVLCTSVVTMLALLVWRNVLGLSLGFARNGVFLVPIFIISCAILVDRAAGYVQSNILRKLAITAACLCMVGITYAAAPSLRAVQVSNWKTQSVCGPLLRQLRDVDASRQWSVALSDRTRTLRLPLLYYSVRGYRLSDTRRDFDITIYAIEDGISSMEWYKPGYFAQFGTKVAISPVARRQCHIPDSDFGPEAQSALLP